MPKVNYLKISMDFWNFMCYYRIHAMEISFSTSVLPDYQSRQLPMERMGMPLLIWNAIALKRGHSQSCTTTLRNVHIVIQCIYKVSIWCSLLKRTLNIRRNSIVYRGKSTHNTRF